MKTSSYATLLPSMLLCATLMPALALSPLPPGEAAGAPAQSEVSRAAAEMGSGTPYEIFVRQIDRRTLHRKATAERLAALKEYADFKQHSWYDSDSSEVHRARATIRPMLGLFGRSDLWDVAVYRQEKPFMGLWDNCIVVISTGLLEQLDAAQLRGLVAHELAHECFAAEAARTPPDDFHALHVIEHKCDMVAALASTLIGDDPYSVVWGLERMIQVREARGEVDHEDQSHPPISSRRYFLKEFLSRSVSGKPSGRRCGRTSLRP